MITIPFIAGIIAIGFSALSGVLIGRYQGAKKAENRVVESLKCGTVAHVGTDVIVGYAVTLSQWLKNETWINGEKKVSATETYTQCDRTNIQHEAAVKIKGTNGYEHPFLNTGSAA